MDALVSNSSPVMCVLKRDIGVLEFRGPHSGFASVAFDRIRSSGLLEDLIDSMDDCAEACLPVTWHGMQLWLDDVQARGSSAKRTHAAVSSSAVSEAILQPARPADKRLRFRASPDAPSAGGDDRHPAQADRQDDPWSLCELMKASDVLIDDLTKDRCAGEIATCLQHHDSTDPNPLTEAVAALPEHLKQSILSRNPLHHCLSHLHPCLHPAALRAHHPSIDADDTLAFHRLPIATVHVALSAATTLTKLRAVSMAGLTLPFDVAPCVSLLGELTALSSLNLHDTGLRQATVGAVAAVLPKLRQLQKFHVSNNLISMSSMRLLAPALQCCTALRGLDLWRTVRLVCGDTFDGLQALARAIRCMPCLTSFALGHYGACTQAGAVPVECHPPAAACSAIIGSLRSRSMLATAKLQLFKCGLPESATRVLNSVTTLGQLQSLHFTWPEIFNNLHVFEINVGALTGLTALDLEFLPSMRGPYLGVIVARLPQLTRLRHLGLKVPFTHTFGEWGAPWTTLARVLPQMVHLSHLSIVVCPQDQRRRAFIRLFSDCILIVVVASLRMRQLQAMHLPIPVHGGAERLCKYVAALVERVKSGFLLSVDLFVWRRGCQGIWGELPLSGFVALFPYVKRLYVRCPRAGNLLQPLADQQAELRTLRALTLEVEEVNMAGSAMGAFLRNLSCLSTLEELQWCVIDEPYDDVPRYTTSFDVAGFASSVRCLSQLTKLHIHHHTRVSEDCDMTPVLRACTSLPKLQNLSIDREHIWRDGACRELLTQLRLKEFFATKASLWEDFAVVLSVISHVHDLRALEIPCLDQFGDGEDTIVQATSRLPAFQIYRDPSQKSQMALFCWNDMEPPVDGV